ncbi:DNA-directed RNA polymerase subunit beta [Virgibacillus soli]|uniref:DNA-directed RNA polymerase subunit beta n=1 Tax=Paracerasibacillus soli TaxID=480284 RepID=A0ABU5CUC1_9BACI|nr:DNA-directed RNA polymerase subunit beta [Virgibacillus soli]MDY0409466.1 DNA-directed RNA polymerase subunit beta [Virgibacillus soli]
MGTKQLETAENKKTRVQVKKTKRTTKKTVEPVAEKHTGRSRSRRLEEEASTSPKTEKLTRAEQRKKQKAEKRKNKKVRLRIFPIWLRIIIVLILVVGALILGLMVGYGIIGDGKPSDVLNKETWLHIVDIVEKKE